MTSCLRPPRENNRVRVTYGDKAGNGHRVCLTRYDAVNRAVKLDEGGRVTTYAFDHHGNTREKVSGNGLVTRKAYDALHRAEGRRKRGQATFVKI